MTIESFGPQAAQVIRAVWFLSGIAFLIYEWKGMKSLSLSSLLHVFFGPVSWTMLGAALFFAKYFPPKDGTVSPGYRLKAEFFIILVGMVPWAIGGIIFISTGRTG